MATEVLGQILTIGPRVAMTSRQSQAQVRERVRVASQSESRVCETQKVGLRRHETGPEVNFLISDRSFAFGIEQFWNNVGWSRSRVWWALGLQTLWRLQVCCLSCHAALRRVPHLDKLGSQQIRQANRGERKLWLVSHVHRFPCQEFATITSSLFSIEMKLGRE